MLSARIWCWLKASFVSKFSYVFHFQSACGQHISHYSLQRGHFRHFLIQLDCFALFLLSFLEFFSLLNYFFNLHMLRFTLCTIRFYSFWQMDNIMYPQIQLHIGYSYHFKTCPVFNLFKHTLTTTNPWELSIFFCLCSFDFSRFLYNWNHKYIAFVDWPVSLSNMHLQLIHVFVA